jgi:hypothetical protein
MATKIRAKEKTILKSLALLQKQPRIRELYAKSIKLYRSGKIRKISDIATSKDISKTLKRFGKQDSLLYRKLLEPIGFPKIELKEISTGRAMSFVSRRRGRISEIDQGIHKMFGVEEQEKRILKVMDQHIEYLGEESFFQKAHKQARTQNILSRNETSQEFYMEYAANYGVDFNYLNMLREGGRKRSAMQPTFLGRMFFYRYLPVDPKISYDFYPLVFVLKQTDEYFEGINFHNMFINDRALSLYLMYDYLNNMKFDKSTKLLFRTFSRVLKTNKKFKLAKAAFRRYHYKDVSSKLIEVHPFDWEIAMMVSTERFYNTHHGKTPSKKIWMNTRKLSRLQG